MAIIVLSWRQGTKRYIQVAVVRWTKESITLAVGPTSFCSSDQRIRLRFVHCWFNALSPTIHVHVWIIQNTKKIHFWFMNGFKTEENFVVINHLIYMWLSFKVIFLMLYSSKFYMWETSQKNSCIFSVWGFISVHSGNGFIFYRGMGFAFVENLQGACTYAMTTDVRNSACASPIRLQSSFSS